MGDIVRDSDVVELGEPPRFDYGECVAARVCVRNDGTYPGREIGELLVDKGDLGYVTAIGSFLQQFWIYSVDFPGRGVKVGMKGRELVSLDKLPAHVQEALGPEKIAQLARLRHG